MISQQLQERVTQAIGDLGIEIIAIQQVGGGDINHAARLETTSKSYFLKWNARPPSTMFAAEAKGLALLKSADALRVPEVVAISEDFLVLEWLETIRPQNPTRLAERLGEGLANLHLQVAEQHGLDHNNFIGASPQQNLPESSWVRFYSEHRLGFQMELARKKGYLPAERERLLNTLCQKLPQLIPDEVAPSLLHGDLWGGNYASVGDDVPVIYDPAIYYGHREIELAFTELFGGFPPRFYNAYNAAYPLDAGYEDRKALYQLYHVMNHMNLFGGGYAVQVDHIAKRYVG